jgi:hypothetical protein
VKKKTAARTSAPANVPGISAAMRARLERYTIDPERPDLVFVHKDPENARAEVTAGRRTYATPADIVAAGLELPDLVDDAAADMERAGRLVRQIRARFECAVSAAASPAEVRAFDARLARIVRGLEALRRDVSAVVARESAARRAVTAAA